MLFLQSMAIGPLVFLIPRDEAEGEKVGRRADNIVVLPYNLKPYCVNTVTSLAYCVLKPNFLKKKKEKSTASAQWNGIIVPIFIFFILAQQSALSNLDNMFKKIPVTKKLCWEQDDLSHQCFLPYDREIII